MQKNALLVVGLIVLISLSVLAIGLGVTGDVTKGIPGVGKSAATKVPEVGSKSMVPGCTLKPKTKFSPTNGMACSGETKVPGCTGETYFSTINGRPCTISSNECGSNDVSSDSSNPTNPVQPNLVTCEEGTTYNLGVDKWCYDDERHKDLGGPYELNINIRRKSDIFGFMDAREGTPTSRPAENAYCAGSGQFVAWKCELFNPAKLSEEDRKNLDLLIENIKQKKKMTKKEEAELRAIHGQYMQYASVHGKCTNNAKCTQKKYNIIDGKKVKEGDEVEEGKAGFGSLDKDGKVRREFVSIYCGDKLVESFPEPAPKSTPPPKPTTPPSTA